MRLKTVIRNINILNMLLLTVILIFAGYGIAPLLEAKITYTPPPAKKHLNALEEKEDETPLAHLPSVLEYALIGDNNLFHPERKIPQEKKEEQPLPKPDFVFYGTLITDDMRIAYMEDLKAPRSTAGRGKRQISMKKGDTMSGFTLKEIEADKIVMVRGEEKMVVSINDPAHPKMRESQGTVAQTTEQKPVPKAPAPSARQQRAPIRSEEPTTVGKQVPAPAVPAVPKAATQSGGSDPRKTLSDFFKRGQTR